MERKASEEGTGTISGRYGRHDGTKAGSGSGRSFSYLSSSRSAEAVEHHRHARSSPGAASLTNVEVTTKHPHAQLI